MDGWELPDDSSSVVDDSSESVGPGVQSICLHFEQGKEKEEV